MATMYLDEMNSSDSTLKEEWVTLCRCEHDEYYDCLLFSTPRLLHYSTAF